MIAATAQATHQSPDTLGHTQGDQILTGPSPAAGQFHRLSTAAGNGHWVVRDGARENTNRIPNAQSNRHQRRVSLAYVSQLTDFQLADEESPARVEFADAGASSAWRTNEAFHPFAIDWSIRQLNQWTGASPIQEGDGDRASMDFALATGDQADNMQRNENVWVRELLEGGTALNFNSGIAEDAAYDTRHPSCAAHASNATEAANYTGVQDYGDTGDPGSNPAYYDPNDPRGKFASWPQWTGLMNRAQTLSITPAGLAPGVPAYVTNGNHDVLVQGNEDANQAFEDIAMGCFKALATTGLGLPGEPEGPDPNNLLLPGNTGMLVPPDPLRRFASKPQIKAIYGANNKDNDHGFEFVSEQQNDASGGNPGVAGDNLGAASYYAWNPAQTPGFRFISLDTNSEGGQTAEGVASGSSNGNIDNPQFMWLTEELRQAQAAGQLIVLFGHHPVRSMTTEIADEQASPPCAGQPVHNDVDHTADTPKHPANPGCDPDPRSSAPVHLGRDTQSGDPRESFVELLDKFPNVIAYVAGHTHQHKLLPFTRSNGTAWWEINTSATADWPQQHRLVEFFDNADGTLSIFGTVLDHGSPAAAPAAVNAGGFASEDLASVGRTLSYNDPQDGPNQSNPGQGTVPDQNAEMLLCDPRKPISSCPLPASASGGGSAAGSPEAGAATVKGETAKVKGDNALVQVSCPAGSGECSGSVTLDSAGKFKLPLAAKKRKRIRLGKGKFKVPAGQTKTVKVKLTRRGKKLIRKRGRVKAIATVKTAVAGKAAKVTKKKITVKGKKRKVKVGS